LKTSPSLYPNPAADRFTLELPPYENPTEIQLTDAQGRTIKMLQTTESTAEINSADYPAGVYFVQVRQGEAQTVLN
jgi:Secretion system C-terminal sorting domain